MEVNGQLHAPAALIPGKSPSTHLVGSCMGLRAGLDFFKKREKSLFLSQNQIPAPPALTLYYTDYTIAALMHL
jgi:hypothetical protein